MHVRLLNSPIRTFFVIFGFIKQTRDVIYDATQEIYDGNYLIHVALIYNAYRLMLCLFIYLYWVFFRPTREFFTHVKTSTLSVKGCKFWPNSTIMAIEQWRFFSVSHHLLWHGSSVYNGHLRGPGTLTPNAERLVDLGLSRLGFEHQPSDCAAAAFPLFRTINNKVCYYIISMSFTILLKRCRCQF